jgi:uncharacterized repeat protein (TIGR03803 family)
MRKSFFIPYARTLMMIVIFAVPAGIPAVFAQTTFWGMTTAGGANGQGVIFSVKSDGSGLTVQYSFAADGIDGEGPYGGLTEGSNGLLYGMTYAGGVNGVGTIFSIDPVSDNYAKLVDFSGTNGSYPFGSLTLYNGLLYGMTTSGGINGLGNIFSYDPVANVCTDVFDLTDSTGANPYGNITVVSNQLFFTTSGGGRNNTGTIAVYVPATNTCTALYHFAASFGNYTNGDLVLYNNVFYGSVSNGANQGGGDVYSYDPVTGKYTDLAGFAQFGGDYGAFPTGLIEYNNLLYSATEQGGNPYGTAGVLFSLDPLRNITTALYGFNPNTSLTTGNDPGNQLTEWNGQLVGMTYAGGAQGDGVVFAYNPASGVLTKLADFNGTNGQQPATGQLVQVLPTATGHTAQTITFQAISKTYGDPNFLLQATSSAGLPVTYNSSDYTVGAMLADGIHITGAGTCTITATQPGNSTYAPATPVSITLTVNPTPLLIAADNQTKYQDQPPPALTISYSGFVNGEDSSYLLTLPVVSTTVTSGSPQGTYPITIGGASSNNYTITYRQGVFTVYGLEQFFTVTDSVVNYGDADFVMGTASSGLTVTYTAADPTIAVGSSTPGELHIVGAGTTRLAIRQTGDATYAPGIDSVLLTVNPAPLTITANNQSIPYGATAPVFTVSYSGFVLGQDSSALTTLPTVISTAPDGVVYPGNYLIEPSAAVSQNYAITYVNGLFTITLAGDSLNAWNSGPGMMTVSILSTAAEPVSLNLYSASGQRMFSTQLSLQNGFNEFSFPMSNFAAGIYIVRVEGSGIHLNQKLRLP